VPYDLEDWQAAFDEEAARLEFDEGLSRRQAESLARKRILELRGHLNGMKTTIVEGVRTSLQKRPPRTP